VILQISDIRVTRNSAMLLLFGALLAAIACGGGPPQEELDAELDRLLQRTRDLAARSTRFDHDQVLDEIGADPVNGTLYRFDEHLEEARYEALPGARVTLEPVLVDLEVEDGLHRSDGIIAFPVDLPTRDISALELQIVSPLLGRLEVELQGGGSGEAVTIEFPAVGDHVLHTYRLEVAETLAAWTSGRLVRLRFRVPRSGDEGAPEIKGVRVLSITSGLESADFGVVHRREGDEVRRSVFQWSSSVLRFQLEVDDATPAELDLGASVLLADRPLKMEIVLVDGGQRRVLLSTILGEDAGWADWRLPLGTLISREITIELRVTADDPNLVFWSNPAVVSHPTRRFNVIVILEDALRADHLSCYGYGRTTSPIKDAFAGEGVRFARCYAQATKTRFSCPSFMTSLYPTATGVEGIWNLHGALDENYVTLAEVLRRRGFVTASIHQNPNAGSPAGLDQGFSYLFENVAGRAKELYSGLPLRWIEERHDRNFFLYLHLADPHEPYHPPEGFRTWFEELESPSTGGSAVRRLDRQDPEWVQEARRALYDGEISFNDHWFAVFLERLDDLGLADDTLVVFMADHGEHLGEHDRWSHNPPGYVEVLHTPLIMVYPHRFQRGLVVDEIVQNLDIMPTILDLAGVDDELLLMQGDSLVPLMTENPKHAWRRNLAYSEEALLKKSRQDPRPYGSIFFDRWHALDSVYAPMELFDLERDPFETTRLRSNHALKARIPAFLRDMQLAELEIWRNITGERQTAVSLDRETISVLKALGYLE
jgi:arylsulfatase A-like enzyme